MKRRILAILLCIAALGSAAFGFSACNETNCPVEWEDMEHFGMKNPTCTQAGWESYDYCPVCQKYWRSPHKIGRETTPEQQRIAPLGHSYSNGKCIRCNKIDPELLPDTLNIPDVEISQAGVLSWGGIKVASKYRIELTDEDGGKHVYDVSDSESYELDLTSLEDGHELAYGKNYASITAYKPYSENIGGETISDDIPVSESKTDFIAIMQNSGYSYTALTYADEYITINGAYADVRTDGEKDYILIEQQMKNADAQSVSFNLANKVKAATGCAVTYYRDSEHRETISASDWRYMSIPAGATDIYMSVSGVDGTRDYVVRALAIKPVQVGLVEVKKSGSGYEYNTLLSDITVLENDYIDINMFYSRVSSTSSVVVDVGFNAYERDGDCVMSLCLGKNYNFYVIENSHLENVNRSLEKYGEAYNCSFVWGDSGSPAYWTLSRRYDYTKTSLYVPASFGNNDTVLLTVNTLGYNNVLEKVVLEDGFTGINSAVFSGCTRLAEVYVPYSAKDNLGDSLFPAALKDTLTVYCCGGTIPNGRWNQCGVLKYFTTVQNATAPSFEEIMK